MRTPMHAALALIIALWSTVATTAVVLACDCDLPRNPGEAQARADAAFVGTVTELRGDRARIAVEAALKGDPSAEFDVDQLARTDCSAGLAVGERWTIFATAGRAGLVTSQCAGNIPMPAADEVSAIPAEAPAGLPLGVLVSLLVVLAVAAASVVACGGVSRRRS